AKPPKGWNPARVVKKTAYLNLANAWPPYTAKFIVPDDDNLGANDWQITDSHNVIMGIMKFWGNSRNDFKFTDTREPEARKKQAAPAPVNAETPDASVEPM